MDLSIKLKAQQANDDDDISLENRPSISVTELRKRKVAPSDEKQSSCYPNDDLNTDLCTNFNLIYKNGGKRTKKYSIIEHIHDFNSKRCADTVCFKLDEAFSGPENLLEVTSPSMHGYFGSVTQFHDKNTQVIMKQKKITGKLEPNEVVVPLKYFKEESHLAHIYGLILDKVGVCYILMEDAAENICVKFFQDHKYQVKIIDFGSCVTRMDNRPVNGVTTEYLPPEIVSIYFEQKMVHSSYFNGSVDVWSAGMVTLYLTKGTHPTICFVLGKPLNALKYNLSMRKEVSKMIASMEEPLDPYFTTGKETIDHLLSHVLKINPESRWKASDAVSFLSSEIFRSQNENG
ncbi:hypothetical protein Btru_033807 [Bulinus truncatus]|nr:hypothetical protein Btru_033807 [Bulinus truncatus]